MMEHDETQVSMQALFRTEVECQASLLTDGLQYIQQPGEHFDCVETLHKAAQYLMNAARLVSFPCVVDIGRAYLDYFATVIRQRETVTPEYLRAMQQGLDLLHEIPSLNDDTMSAWPDVRNLDIRGFLNAMRLQQDDTSQADVYTMHEDVCTMHDLFQIELTREKDRLADDLLALKVTPVDVAIYPRMRKTLEHIKQAGRLMKIDACVQMAHSMAQLCDALIEGRLCDQASFHETMLLGTHLFDALSKTAAAQLSEWLQSHQQDIDHCMQLLHDHVDVKSTSQPQASAEKHASIDIGGINILDQEMLGLFQIEVEDKANALSEALLELEQDATEDAYLDVAMRAAHSIKGAAHMVGIEPAVHLAHVMEDVFVAAQAGQLVLSGAQMDVLLLGVDMIRDLAGITIEDAQTWFDGHALQVRRLVGSYQQILQGETVVQAQVVAHAEPVMTASKPDVGQAKTVSNYRKVTKRKDAQPKAMKKRVAKVKDSAIRVSAQSLNRLMGLAGESLIESRWIRPFLDAMLTLKRHHIDLISALDSFREMCVGLQLGEHVESTVREIQEKAGFSREELVARISDLEDYERRATNLAARLNREVIASRMRPFADGVHGFRRMVRDVARSLGKEINFEINGMATQVDRDILEQIEAPLNHVLRNAIDHGIELPDARAAMGKPRQANIRLEAAHVSGMLSIAVSDDGCGIDVENIRRKILDIELATEEMAQSMTKAELLEFLFLPSFTTKDKVTELSGRGVGLDVVHSAMQEMRGAVRITTKLNEGSKFHLQLPLTLSVVRALTVEIAGEPYAFPLARVEHTLKVPQDSIAVMEGRKYFTMGNQHIGVIPAWRILGMQPPIQESDDVSLVLVGERMNRYGLIVDRFLGERALVVHALDHRLGKVKDVSSASIMDDGTPVLIIDVDDMIRSIDLLVSGGRLGDAAAKRRAAVSVEKPDGPQRVLIVDDSIVVREVERNMLEAKGYEVEVAVDGADGWNAVRDNSYDLVISDIDMPRMNGFEFVSLVKRDPNLASLPVMIVSYKDRDEDRVRGMEVGADYYLTKGSFQDDTLIDAVVDLIGEA